MLFLCKILCGGGKWGQTYFLRIENWGQTLLFFEVCPSFFFASGVGYVQVFCDAACRGLNRRDLSRVRRTEPNRRTVKGDWVSECSLGINGVT